MVATTSTEILSEEKERPAFLTVLCILTFIWCGIMLITLLFEINETFFLSTQEQIEKMEKELEQAESIIPGITERTIGIILETEKYKIPNWLLAFIGNILSLAGAIMMWKLRRIGFWIYAVAEVIPFLLSVFAFNALKSVTGTFAMFGSVFEKIGTMIAVLIILIFDAAFIGMYAANLKHMKYTNAE